MFGQPGAHEHMFAYPTDRSLLQSLARGGVV
jgi:hypothetical protein